MYIYDGTYEGFLTVIFFAFAERKLDYIIRGQDHSGSLISASKKITVDMEKANRVKYGLIKLIGERGEKGLYRGFHSEAPGIEDTLFYIIKKIFQVQENFMREVLDPQVMKLTRLIGCVEREEHRMLTTIRLEAVADKILFAEILPDYNVLPLLSEHILDTYPKQHWLIFDRRRSYCLIFLHGDLYTKTMTEHTYLKWKANPVFYFVGERSESFL